MTTNSYPIPSAGEGDMSKNPGEPTYEMVRYNDGALNLRLTTPGTKYRDLPSKYTDDLRWGLGASIAVKTQSGNTYAVGQGILLNVGAGTYYDMEDWSVVGEPEVGKPWVFGGGGITTRVTEIEMQYKVGVDSSWGSPVDGEDPFKKISPLLQSCSEDAEQRKSR